MFGVIFHCNALIVVRSKLSMGQDPSVWEPNPKYDQYLHGLMNITTAKKSSKGAPVYASLPHYCGAKDDFVEGVEGLACNMERHALFADVEPNTGRL